MEHKCRALEGRRLSIDYDYDERGWYMRGGAIKDRCIVFHCPYCGEKLELPEKTLEDIYAALGKCQQEHCHRMKEFYQRWMLGKESELPDEKVEVSREHLECWRLTLREAAYRDRQSIRNSWTIAGDILRILVAHDNHPRD